MDTQEGNALFKEADGLFRHNRFQEALVALEKLNTAYPGTRNIMFPRALCLQKLGRIDEAEAVCDEMAQRFQDPRIQALKQQLQAARATLDPFAGLDANGLDDLFERPAKKTAPPRTMQSSFDVKRYLLIGAVVLAVLGIGYFGYRSYANRETIEQVQAKILDAWSKADAYSATLSLSGQMKQGNMTMNVTGGASLDFMKKDTSALFRLEGSTSISGLAVPMDATLLVVSDGTSAYIQYSMMGNQMVMKFPVPPMGEMPPNAASLFFDKFKTEMDMRLLREEVLEGQPSYVIEMTPKPGSQTASAVSKSGKELGKAKVYFTKDFKSQVRCVFLDKSAAPMITLSLKNIDFHPSLSPERFAFKPPAGVEVMDMSNPNALKALGAGGLPSF